MKKKDYPNIDEDPNFIAGIQNIDNFLNTKNAEFQVNQILLKKEDNQDSEKEKDNINIYDKNENEILSNIQSKKFANYNLKTLSEIKPQKDNKIKDKNEICDSTNKSTKNKSFKKLKIKKKPIKKKTKIKVKRILINTIISYVNHIIKKVYRGKIGQGLFNRKIIRKIKPSESENITIAHNKELLIRTLKEILSTNISVKYTSIIITDLNKKIIDLLLNEESKEKRKIFTDLFNKTFLDWISMLSDPEGQLKVIYEKELYKRKKDENEINQIKQIIKNFESQFLKIK